MAPLRSTHVQLGDVPLTLDPVEAEGEFRQHDDVVTVMMKLPVGEHSISKNFLRSRKIYLGDA